MSRTKGVNSAGPTTAQVVGGVYNATPPVLEDGQAAAIQLDVNGQIKTTGGGSGTGDVNLVEINGSAPALTNPLPVELSDGTNPVGTAGNPLSVNIITGGGSNASVSATGAAVPASATYEGLRGSTTVPTAVTDGQMVAGRSDKYGNTVSVLNAPRDLIGTAVVSNNSSASGVSFIGAGASNVFNDIITLIITNRSSTATVVSLTDGTATYTFAIAANGGLVCNFPTPLPATSSATAWTIGNSATIACDYVAVYAKNK